MKTKYENAIVGEVTATQIGQDTPGIDANWQRLLASLPGSYFLVNDVTGSNFILREELFTQHFTRVRDAANVG